MKTNSYGQAAMQAALVARESGPVDAWKNAVQRIFPNQLASQKKGCPKGAFLGLCEEGLVVDIVRGKYTRSKLNREYALRAVQLLKDGLQPASPSELWIEVMNGEGKVHNSQCDVVLALWGAKLIV